MQPFNSKMRILVYETIFILLVPQFGLCRNKTTTTTQNNDVRDLTLFQRLNSRKSLARLHWSAWSNWSPCSRTCDGGVSYQLRTCRSHTGCHGDSIRHKICNMQPCPEAVDFREEQCASYNSIPYHDTLFQWSPHHDPNEPCALICRGVSSAISNATSTDTTVIVVQLSSHVHDGTRCRPGSLDMCISGKCQRVGCDLKIGSARQVDECGVCGGDGSSCAQPLYQWVEASASLCSVTCGGGYKMSRPICKNRLTNEEVDEYLCNVSLRPLPEIVECNQHPCPARWSFEPWSSCSTSCGPGIRHRKVYCSETYNGTSYKVAQHRCSGFTPYSTEPCNNGLCPVWVTTDWSECSVTCGEGVRKRKVTCSPETALCMEEDRPSNIEPCMMSAVCENELLPNRGGHVLWENFPEYQLPLLHPYPPIGLPATAERLVAGPETTPSEATFMAEAWGPCSVTCGEGIRRREVQCKIFLELTRTVAELPEEKCSGPRPPNIEKCFRDPCSFDNRMDMAKDVPVSDQYAQQDYQPKVAPQNPHSTYSWKQQGFTHCSESCLGGIQESIIDCVRDIDQKPCSEPCGIGIQLREVNCIHEVTRGGNTTVVVPNSMCPEPPPLDRQHCNIKDCPPKWTVGNWSKCSKACEGGVKTRNITCQQIKVQGLKVQLPASMCNGRPPIDRKPCNTKPCDPTDRPVIAEAVDQNYVQTTATRKKVTIKVGGTAHVFFGTQLKIRCPVKRFDRAMIQWQKDHQFLPQIKRIYVSKKGALTIKSVKYEDKGVYTCVASLSTADLQLTVKPYPGHFPNSEEVNQPQKGSHFSGSDVPSYSGDMGQQNPFKMTGSSDDDLSHEYKPDGKIPKIDRPRKQKAKSTTTTQSPPYFSDIQEGNLSSTIPSTLSTSVKSGGARAVPHFQHLLANLQTFGNVRGYRNLIAEGGFFESPRYLPLTADHLSHEGSGDLTEYSEEEISPPVLLGKGDPKNIKFEWNVTDWSECPEPCSTTGTTYQIRSAQCIVRLEAAIQQVRPTLCEDVGLATPTTVQNCPMSTIDDCPHWSAPAWPPCEESRCFAWHTAMQRRNVSCMFSNGTEAPLDRCENSAKPLTRQECFNDRCKGTWKVGEWSECGAECEKEGIKYRILQCVWFGTKKPAGNACRDQPRPSVMKVCKGPPCAQRSDCKDHSQFCHSVLTRNMCRVYRFQTQCCRTCRSRLTLHARP